MIHKMKQPTTKKTKTKCNTNTNTNTRGDVQKAQSPKSDPI